MSINLGETSKPFPFFPPYPTERELKRMELILELNKWDNNDEQIARRHAETLIELLENQFALVKPAK